MENWVEVIHFFQFSLFRNVEPLKLVKYVIEDHLIKKCLMLRVMKHSITM